MKPTTINPDNYSILMAGGIGARFWPMSRTNCPKQFIDVMGSGETLIQQTYPLMHVAQAPTMEQQQQN